jgi:hypothetical protein
VSSDNVGCDNAGSSNALGCNMEYLVILENVILDDAKINPEEANKFSDYIDILIRMYKLNSYNELPDFIKMYILLKSFNNLPLNKDFFTYGRNMSYLDVILEYNYNKNGEQYLYTQMLYNEYLYLLHPEYKFIPLFKFSLGMGYSFLVGYDMMLDKLIGFIEGGGCAQEYEYNKILIEKYMKLDKQHRITKYNTNCCQNKSKSKSKSKNELLENIKKYLELFTIDIVNLPDHYNYFNEMKLNILDN